MGRTVLRRIRNSFSSRRKQSDDNSERGSNSSTTRKVSIDQTVLSGDDNSRHNRSIQSFDVSEASSPMYRRSSSSGQFDCPVVEGRQTNEVDTLASTLRRTSLSDPSFLAHYPIETDSSCHCDDCYLQQRYSMMSNGYYGVPNQQLSAQNQSFARVDATASASPQFSSFYSPVTQKTQPPLPAANNNSSKQDDPALRARVEAVQIQQQLLGQNHPDVIFALSSLAKLHQKRGNYKEAETVMRESQMRSLLANTVPPIRYQNEEVSQGSFVEDDEDERCNDVGGGVAIPGEISFSM